MKIQCPNCQTPNPLHAKNCTDCQFELHVGFNSQFVTDKGEVLTIINLLSKVEQLEQRLGYVEENYAPKSVQHKIQEEIKPIEKEAVVEKIKFFPIPYPIPQTLAEWQDLLVQIEQAKEKSKAANDSEQYHELNFESKRIEQKIRLLQEEEQEKVEQENPPVIVENIVEKNPYPNTINELKELLEQVLAEKETALTANDLDAVSKFETEEKSIHRRIKNLELAAQYGKSDESQKEEVQDTQDKPVKKINKQLVFEIEQELSAIWKTKQKAAMEQQIIQLALLTDKENALKEELRLAQNGSIQERQKDSSEKQTEIAVTLDKTIPQTKAAVKKIKAEPQGPSASEQFFAPLINAVAFIENHYNQYKEEGKLSLFFLTIAGIVTLLFGFGFLAQYSAVTYFGDYLTQIKVGFGFVCSTAAIGIGIRLIGKDPKYVEFGAALMGLGLSLNYLFIYFLSAEPSPLINSSVGFVLILLNTAVSIFMSVRYQSKIIAVLALFGGALSPSYLHSNGENTHIYFAYLWILCAASAFVAHRLTWDLLNFISFLLAAFILGSSVYLNYTDVRTLPDNMYLLLFHVFGYLYAYCSLFDGFKPKKEQTSMTIITLVGSQAAMMISLYVVYGLQQQAYNTLAINYLLNMLPFAAVTAIFWNSWSMHQQSLLIGVSSAFVAAAIPAYFGAVYRGLLWALEGIVLLGGGLVFRLAIVRRIAYSILAVALISMLDNLGWNALPDRATNILFTRGYINLWSLGIVLMTLSILFKKYEENLEHHETKVPVLFNEIISVWFVFMFYITTFFFFEFYAYNLALVLMAILLLWNNYRKLYIAEILGWGQFLVLIGVLFQSMEMVNSPHFADQLLYGKLAMIEIVLVLWGGKLFYEKVLPDAPAYKHQWAEYARELSYLIMPLAILDAFNHSLPAYILYGLWLMALATFVLAEFTKSKAVLVEFLLFVVVATGTSFVQIEYGALLVGNILLLGVSFYKKSWTEAAFEKPDLQLVYLLAPYFLIASVGLVYFKASNDDLLSAVQITAAGLLTLVNIGHQLEPVKRTLNLAYRVAWGASFIALGILFLELNTGVFTMPSTIFIGFGALLITLAWSFKMIYKADIPYQGDKKSFVWQAESIWVHVLSIMSYVTFLYLITNDMAGLWLTILLFVHGIALVFNGLSPNFGHLTKVYIPIFCVALGKLFFVDMKDAETIMKIIVFIVVGVICLLAAYFLIKYKDKGKDLTM